jgi:hypothetical protein
VVLNDWSGATGGGISERFVMRVNGALGHPVGYLNPFLYQNGTSRIFNDITQGNNNDFHLFAVISAKRRSRKYSRTIS